MKPVSLTVHKNTLNKHRAKKYRKRINKAAQMAGEIEGFAIVAWDSEGYLVRDFSTGNKNPSDMPDFVRSVLLKGVYD